MISPDLLEILACPACDARPPVKLVEVGPDDRRLECSVCRRRYPIVDGIPVMLVEEAQAALPPGQAGVA